MEQISDSNNYFLYCFYSPTEFSSIQLDQNFNKISEINDYKINENSLNECDTLYFSRIFYSLNSYKVLTSCNGGILSLLKYETEKEYVDSINMKTNIPQNSIEIKMKKILSNLNMDELYEIDGIGYKTTISLINI